MWKRLLVGVGLLMLLVGGVAGWMVVRMYRPDLLHPDLRQALSVDGLTVGRSTRQDLLTRLGPPEQEHEEPMSHLYTYPSRGIAARVDNGSGLLVWLELTSPMFATAQGVRVGETFATVTMRYGPPTEIDRLSGATRVRYHYGVAYALEFWVGPGDRVIRIALFRS